MGRGGAGSVSRKSRVVEGVRRCFDSSWAGASAGSSVIRARQFWAVLSLALFLYDWIGTCQGKASTYSSCSSYSTDTANSHFDYQPHCD